MDNDQDTQVIYQHVKARGSSTTHLARLGESLTLCGRWARYAGNRLHPRPTCARCRRLSFNSHDA